MRVDAKLLVPGAGEPTKDGTVIWEGGRITFVGSSAEVPRGAAPADVFATTVMPGLWDCHVHFTGQTMLEPAGVAVTPPLVGAVRATKDAALALESGFTSVRELGGYGLALAVAVQEGVLPGPHIYAAGSAISPTGGHSDLHMYPLGWTCQMGSWDGQFAMCDGIPDCLRTVRQQLRRGARVIKVCASGGAMSQIDDPHHQQFSDEELSTIVQEAARSDRVVAAHAHGKAGILAALRAGCRTIEHGSWLDEEAARMILDHDAVLVPTRMVNDQLFRFGREHGIPEYGYRKVAALAQRHSDAVGIAHQLGVTIAMGTDAAPIGSSGLPNRWGQNAQELELLVKDGLTPLQAIAAATANGPRTLGPQAPQSGELRIGYDADIIAVDGDPIADVSVLADSTRITHVIKSGSVVKSPATVA